MTNVAQWMDQEIDPEIREALHAGEKLLWSGQPKRGFIFRLHDVALIPFSLMWGGFAFFWEYSVVSSNAPLFMKIWGIPFVLIGIYLIVGRFFVDAHARRGTRYALTDKRIIIVGGVLKHRTVSYVISGLKRIDLTEHRDGTATVHIGTMRVTMHALNWPNDFSWTGWTPNRLDHIQNGREVYEKIIAGQN